MLKIITGDTIGFTFSIVFAGAVATTPAPDLSACTVKFMIKKSLKDKDSNAAFAEEIVNPDSNIVYFTMSSEDSKSLAPGGYKAACKLFYDNGTEITVWQSDITVIQGVFNG